jgi:hypothetical protein
VCGQVLRRESRGFPLSHTHSLSRTHTHSLSHTLTHAHPLPLSQVLVTAPSNVAVDHLSEKIHKTGYQPPYLNCPFGRLGVAPETGSLPSHPHDGLRGVHSTHTPGVMWPVFLVQLEGKGTVRAPSGCTGNLVAGRPRSMYSKFILQVLAPNRARQA